MSLIVYLNHVGMIINRPESTFIIYIFQCYLGWDIIALMFMHILFHTNMRAHNTLS